jgi:hypothetical protein
MPGYYIEIAKFNHNNSQLNNTETAFKTAKHFDTIELVINKKVGNIIDSAEKAEFNLFKHWDSQKFKSARFIQNSYTGKIYCVAKMKDGSTKKKYYTKLKYKRLGRKKFNETPEIPPHVVPPEVSRKNNRQTAAAFFSFAAIIIAGIIAGVLIIFIIIESILVELSKACFIATMVYGSYDAQEVMILRKFRDEKLKPYFFGRVFIRFYYSTSPLFVKMFRKNKPVKYIIKRMLDAWVNRLQKREPSVYSDYSV